MKTTHLIILLVLGAILNTSFYFAQTKLIFHKSHSGSVKSFKMAYEKNLFDIGTSNFGMAPTTIVKNAELDSLIFLDDSTTIMITSEYCEDRSRFNRAPKRPNNSPDYSDRDTDNSTLWRPGKVVIQNHPDFNRKNPIDSIKKTLKVKYNFVNRPESVVFIDSSIDQKEDLSTNDQLEKERNPNEHKERVKQKANSEIFKGIWVTIAIIVISTLSTGVFNRW